MDDYVPGCIADLISNAPGLKSKSKKSKKLKSENISEISETKSEESSTSNEKNKKHKKKPNENSDIKIENKDNVVNEAVNFTKEKKKVKKKPKAEKIILSENNSMSLETDNAGSIENSGLKNKISKKRKKSLAASATDEDKHEAPKNKKTKTNVIHFDHVPSDSEEDEKKNLDMTSVQKKSDYTDFTENTVFVGNIPINFDKHKISKVFSKFGEVQNARIRCVPIADINTSKKVAAIKKKFNPKRNSLVAYVKFKSKESTDSALRANGMILDGHHIRIDLAEENKERDTNKAVFVGGLPFDIEDDELWEFFEGCGKINSVRVIRDSQTSMGKGFGYVNFDSTASVELALKLNGEQLKKRVINVKRCVKSRNKNKLNAFGKKKSRDIATTLLCKRGKKFKEERKKLKKEKRNEHTEFQGRTANMKQKKKKKLSKSALRQRKLVKILGT